MTTIKSAPFDASDPDSTLQVEGEIREFVRRDLTPMRRHRDPDLPVDNVTSLISRVAGQSVHEIDHVVTELQNVRDILRNEADRVQREIIAYANLNQATMASMKVIGESMAQWKASMAGARERV